MKSFRLDALALLAAAAASAGCEPTIEPDTPRFSPAGEVVATNEKLDAFLKDAVAVLCSEEAPCSQIGGPFLRPSSDDACPAIARAWLQGQNLIGALVAQIRFGRLDLDSAAMQQCLADLGSHCGFSLSCRAMARGRLSKGAACSWHGDCASGFCAGLDGVESLVAQAWCAGSCAEQAPCAGRCATAPQDGAPCSDGAQCATDQACVAGACRAAAVATGESCSAGLQTCAKLGPCFGGTCEAGYTVGTPCVYRQQCGHGLRCDMAEGAEQGKCVALPAADETCSGDLGCMAPDLVCDVEELGGTATCTKRPGLGDACSFGYQCTPPYWCAPSSGTCIEAPSEGQPCLHLRSIHWGGPTVKRVGWHQWNPNTLEDGNTWLVCADGLVCSRSSDTCVRRKRVGEKCKASEECGGPFECIDGTCRASAWVCGG